MKRGEEARTIVTVAALSLLGALLIASWFFLRGNATTSPPVDEGQPQPVGTAGSTAGADSSRSGGGNAHEPLATEIEELRDENLQVPIDGADVEKWKGSFEESHGGHPHEAVDILAPRNTPIHAVSDGRIAKLFTSKAGGLTIYELDPSQRFIFYYAHLQRYADTLRQDAHVARGDVIGYVGTSGNAPPDTPHLHFTIFRVSDPQRWWEGSAIDPYLVFTHGH